MLTLKHLVYIILIFCLSKLIFAQETETNLYKAVKSSNYISDNQDGMYRNPIIFADYSDPDVIRVGDDYYLTSSSFASFPGLPILHSKDLVNWEIINHAVLEYPLKSFDKPQHGNGIWAPSLRYHNNEFYIFFGDPDNGIFMTKTKDIRGKWEPIHLVKKALGWIDPCPFWDDDGNTYLVHAWARSRSGIKHKLTINKLNNEGTKILDEGTTVFMDSVNYPTMEGPKFYKRNGYYYIFAPAGGVKPGWQAVLRSKNIYGKYEVKTVLEQGSTNINGPHQGGWVKDQNGKFWFIHFQDRDAYGRVVWLEPMCWEEDWPIMGKDFDNNGIGEPVADYEKPEGGKSFPVEIPATSDEFDSNKMGLQWQWEGNYIIDPTTGNSKWISLDVRKGWLRFYSQLLPESSKNLWSTSSLMMQKFPAPEFSVTAKLEFFPNDIGDKAGLLIFGLDYSFIGIEKTKSGLKIFQAICNDADKGNKEIKTDSVDADNSKIFLNVEVTNNIENPGFPICIFSYSVDGEDFKRLGKEFIAKPGKWIGAKVGVFSTSANKNNDSYTDFDFVKVSVL